MICHLCLERVAGFQLHLVPTLTSDEAGTYDNADCPFSTKCQMPRHDVVWIPGKPLWPLIGQTVHTASGSKYTLSNTFQLAGHTNHPEVGGMADLLAGLAL